jgi:hypothetical protein
MRRRRKEDENNNIRGKEEEEKVVPLTFGYAVYYFIITLPYCGKAFAWLLLGWEFCLFLAGGDEVWSRFIYLGSFSAADDMRLY